MVVRFCLSAGFPFLESTILKILSEAPYLWDFNFCIFRFGWACNWTKEIFYGSNSQTPTIRRDHLVVKGLQRRRTRLPLLSVDADAAVASTPVAAAAAVGSTKDRLLLRGAVAWGIVALQANEGGIDNGFLMASCLLLRIQILKQTLKLFSWVV